MSINEQEEFDPALKSAVQRAWCGEKCPLELRNSIESMLARRSGIPIFRVLWPVAAAAMLVLAVGFWWSNPASTSSAMAAALPVSLQQSLVHTHMRCCHAKSHQHLGVITLSDDAGIARAMQAKLSRSVLMARPIEEGWNFRGAAICGVGATAAGHLVFCKDDSSISVFSLPGSLLPSSSKADHFEMTSAEGYPIVAFKKNDGLFCIVGSGPRDTINLHRLEQLESGMESKVLAIAPGRRAPAGELMYAMAR